MAGETIKTRAVCLGITPWSKTSHVVSWLTPSGRVGTVVKGAVRPKSAFLGQYDLNYTCEILYYARAKGELHALREASPLSLREGLRQSYRALALADYFRWLSGELSPAGEDARPWYDRLTRALDTLASDPAARRLRTLVAFELDVLRLAGLKPDFSGYDPAADWSSFGIESGSFDAVGEGRHVRVSRAVAALLDRPAAGDPGDETVEGAARVLGAFLQFHLDLAPDVRRSVLRLVNGVPGGPLRPE